MRSRIWVILWVVGILFPMEFVARVWPAFGKGFNVIFASDWTHIFMHSLLYAVFGLLLARWIAPTSGKTILILIGMGLLVGCLQESLQLLVAHAWPGWPAEIEDLSVDLVGTIIGIGFSRLFAPVKHAVEGSH